MARILGLSAFYHDSAAALVVDGRVVAAAQEERFTRIKHDARFPTRAVAYCLAEAGIRAQDLDYIAFYEKPLVKFERLLETYLAYAPAGFDSFRRAMPLWLRDKLHLRRAIRQALPEARRARLVFTDHHESHAASAFFPSPFLEAAVLTLDGVGEWTTTAWGVGRGHQLELHQHLRFPHSLGLLYSAFTYYCGFKVNSGEYKLMGLAPYGTPRFVDAILGEVIELKEDGSFWLNPDYFNYCQGLTMTSNLFHERFGGPPRAPESRLEPRHMDLAASIQKVTEEVVLRIARTVHRATGQRHLALAGGVALNCVANGRLLREGPFDDLWVQPAAGDAGGALGAALFTHHHLLESPRSPASGRDTMQGSLLGPAFTNDFIRQLLRDRQLPFQSFDQETALLETAARELSDGRIVGWFHGRMEFGPRALGARSILADPRAADTQSTLNLKIKFRESFRPFAPIVLREKASEWFDLHASHESPYMLVVAPVLERHRRPLSDADQRTLDSDADLCRRVSVVRSSLPAITHVDYSARVQTVDTERHPRLHRLLSAFEQRTGCPVLVNTSFNVRGEPIVCTPEEALRCFLATDMDVLVLEDQVLFKSDMPAAVTEAERSRYLAAFAPD